MSPSSSTPSGRPNLKMRCGNSVEEWAGRVNLRLLGPLAPYDFVVTRNQMG